MHSLLPEMQGLPLNPDAAQHSLAMHVSMAKLNLPHAASAAASVGCPPASMPTPGGAALHAGLGRALDDMMETSDMMDKAKQ